MNVSFTFAKHLKCSRALWIYKWKPQEGGSAPQCVKNENYFQYLIFGCCASDVFERHLRFLMTDIFKSIPEINPKLMWSYFARKELPYNLRKRFILILPRINSTYYSATLFTLRELWYGIILLLLLDQPVIRWILKK